MERKLFVNILPQPDDVTCGPTCLHAVYRYYEDHLPLAQVIEEVTHLEEGGTLAVYLAQHALRRGYRAVIYSYNLQLFDPTWFPNRDSALADLLKAQLAHKNDPKLREATYAYLEFLQLGGRIRFEVLTKALIRRHLNRGIPILTGLSATYLYGSARELDLGRELIYDDIRGEPTGHFVVLAGYDRKRRSVLLADPSLTNPVSASRQYEVHIDRLICSLMLGILTYDANLLIIEPHKRRT